MKQLLSALFLFASILLFDRCANPTALSGGDKDTIPPTLISANPANQTVNFKGKEFILYFDESINADKLSQELLITPTTDNRFTHLIRKERLTIKFDEEFDDSTTYTFNFRNGVGDATEKNPVVNLKLAFSTGTYIDSLMVTGRVTDFIKQTPVKSFLISLYNLTDTLSYDLVKPMYFTTTLEDGTFLIENIKNGKYLLFGFHDENNNLLFEPSDESFAIHSDTLILDSNYTTDTLNLESLKVNAAKLSFISARPSGKTFVARYNKPLTHINVKQLNATDTPIKYAPNEDNSELIFYPGRETILPEDSIGYIIEVIDTLNNTTIDTVFVKFLESSRKPKEFKASISSSTIRKDTIHTVLQFNKPISKLNLSQFSLIIDTLLTLRIDSNSLLTSDPFSRKYSLKTLFSQNTILDSINSIIASDSSRTFTELPSVSWTINTDAIQSVEFDTLIQPITYAITKPKTEDTGTINLTISTEYKSFEVRLINSNGSVIRSFENEKQKTLTSLPTEKYQIMILIDSNENGRWDIANPLLNQVSEPIYNYHSQTELRPNWIIDIEDISF